MELLFNFLKFFTEDLSLTGGCINFLLEDLSSPLEHLDVIVIAHVRDPVTLVISHNTLGANHYLIILTKVFTLLLGVTNTILDFWSFLDF